MSVLFVNSGRKVLLLSATLAASIPVLSAPVNAQGLLSRIGRTLERIEQKTAEIENKAATLERSVTQVKQAADGIDRTVETAGALLSGDQEGGDQVDMAGDTGAMQPTEAWQAEEAAMMPGQPLAAETADAPLPVQQGTVSVSKKEPRQ